MKSAIAVITLILLAFSGNALGFGQNGHRVVAQLAENHLTPAARRAVDEILRGESMAMVSTWPDEMRSSPEPFWLKGVGYTWHFINTDKLQSYEQSVKNPKGDVYEAINRFIGVLNDPAVGTYDRRFALRWLIHLVGDVHQPLHVGHATDLGGNQVKVKWFGAETNLHTVWDTKIIESQNLSYSEFTTALDTNDLALIRTYQGAAVIDWVNESADIRDEIYNIGEGEFSYPYLFQHLPIIKSRLLKAGIRLAGVLNDIYENPGEAR